jgi:hypothetical protein
MRQPVLNISLIYLPKKMIYIRSIPIKKSEYHYLIIGYDRCTIHVYNFYTDQVYTLVFF